ncbi:uncharacterized protein LOC108470294 [Gossypium arboreum]|uniref:RRM domain-containing protein n=1 Tax=Gossypium arboreum TaxID=29729 RepID=A0ABR0P1T5_GOSAR|nr:uncharacterized protein LOC108470294 [Gossypium arboreum]KAK5812407.1 hypothetical protein PVK06_027837 [Gossypium arboreum]
MMKTMGMSSFSSSTFLFTSLHFANGGSSSRSSHVRISENTATIFLASSLLPLSQSAHFPSLSVFPNIDFNRLRASAFNKGRKGSGGTTLFEMDGSDEDDDGDEFIDFDDEFDADGEDGDEAMFLPLGKMKKWLENKPRGFGEGKVYDTSIEEKLLEEIEQSRQAQTVNVNNLKNNPVKPGSKKDDQQNKEAESVLSGIRVRVGNLPKKKNIHRDLKAAFDGVSGIINISPAVSGNKKTKDPVCKGFAFVEFKHEVDAIRFVQNFSGHNLTFGRIQKQIKCEMINSLSHSPAHEELWDNGSITDEVAISHFVDGLNPNFDMKNSSSDISLESVSDEVDNHDDELVSDELDDLDDELVSDEFDDQDDEFDEVEVGEGRNNLNAISEAEASTADIMEPRFKRAAADSIASTPLERIRALEQKLLARGKQQRVPKEQKAQKLERVRSNNKKKVVAKQNQQKVTKEQKVQKLDIPGSAKRLKIKEKAQLTGVFSKYGLKTPSNSKEES